MDPKSTGVRMHPAAIWGPSYQVPAPKLSEKSLEKGHKSQPVGMGGPQAGGSV
jgi:hypothetical protein